MKGKIVRTVLAIAEPLVIFIVGARLFRLVVDALSKIGIVDIDPQSNWVTLLRICFIIGISLALEIVIRHRGIASWGIDLGRNSMKSTFAYSGWLLVIGGIVPLFLSLFITQSSMIPTDLPAQLGSLFVPVLSQEVFLVGYAQRRFSDAVGPVAVRGLVVVLFIAAHLNHFSGGGSGILFLVAMGWQGLCWSYFRAVNGSIIPLILSHFTLLICYYNPLISLILVAILGILLLATQRRLLEVKSE